MHQHSAGTGMVGLSIAEVETDGDAGVLGECSRKELDLAVSCEEYESPPIQQDSCPTKEMPPPPKGYRSKESGEAAFCGESILMEDFAEPKKNNCQLEFSSKVQESDRDVQIYLAHLRNAGPENHKVCQSI